MTFRAFHPEAMGFDPANARLLADLLQLLAADDAYAARESLEQAGLPRFVAFGQQQARAIAAGNDRVVLVTFQGLDGGVALRQLAAAPQELVETSLGGVNGWMWREFASIRENVLETILALRDAGQRIWLTGHGVGGVWAVLMAGILEKDRQIPVQGVVTWGAPRVGHRDYALRYHRLSIGASASLLERTTRIVLDRDPFPALPPTADDYAAIGRKCHFDIEGRLLTGDDPRLAELVAGANVAALEESPPELSDHALGAYREALELFAGRDAESWS